MFNSIKKYPLSLLFQGERDKTYIPFSIVLEKLIISLIKEKGISVHLVSSRVKSLNSFSEKIKRKGDKYYLLDDVTDLIGIRVITHLESEVDIIKDIITSNFRIDEKNSEDKRNNNEVDAFGYQSLHLIGRLGTDRKNLPEYNDYVEIPFEIQIRSVLQHAWAEIQHDINYKAKTPIDSKTKRKIHRVAALLEQADEIFTEISKEIENNKVSSNAQLSNFNETKLTPELLSELLESDNRLIQLQQYLETFSNGNISNAPEPLAIVGLRLKDLNKVGINTLKDLDDGLNKSQEYIRDFMALMFMDEAYENDRNDCDEDASTYFRSASLTYICRFIAGLSKDLTYILDSCYSSSAQAEDFELEEAKSIIKHIERLKVV
ncbi:hypothetical protein QDG88_00410 [Pseudoalteromonas piscicida]|uniref:GTP pyrophosphokinase n=1 Tax=Pseudoalteromonas piscicida TaxID=43662 RepID=UPI002739107C|nr:hypothetical protein [Pseudoalteromonas piscicida]MDP4486405.1 hypothetical protein [Pseudoalteromonas piscicida]